MSCLLYLFTYKTPIRLHLKPNTQTKRKQDKKEEEEEE